ncbi:helix-turn-helix transcriptional regulator [Aliarcobacter butzleri]|uniref:helix-turn-helix transcriptional regulator n=1 Tax=Aliarcobacter butzleri TaxID=28197 RepID=UPI003B21AD3D
MSNINNTQKFMRAKELAKYLGIGLSTVWLYAKQGKITPIKLSDKVTAFYLDEINKKFGIDEVEKSLNGGVL